jgi:hypothetical protein
LQSLPDSFYALTFSNAAGAFGAVSLLATPGAAADQYAGHEPTSRIVESRSTGLVGVGLGPVLDSSSGADGLARPDLSSVRLAAGDGDELGHQDNVQERHLPFLSGTGRGRFQSDGLMDWAVGEVGATRQGVAYTTSALSYGLDAPQPMDCPSNAVLVGAAGSPDKYAGCTPKSPGDLTGQTNSNQLFSLSSYALNGFTMVGKTGAGWAVGDRGALVALGNAGGSGSTVPPESSPKLGAARPTSLSNRQAYGPFRPLLSSEPGFVPPLESQPVQELSSPRFVAAGSPNPLGSYESTRNENVQDVVMSRDGSEGWAIGPTFTGEATTLYHFAGGAVVALRSAGDRRCAGGGRRVCEPA